MGKQQKKSSGAIRSQRGLPRIRPAQPLWRNAFLVFLTVSLSIVVFLLTRKKITLPHFENAAAAQAASLFSPPAHTSASLPDRELEEISHLAPQQQAERLLERANIRPQESLNLILQNVDGWRGHLQDKGRLFALIATALNSDDLRVRTAAVEIDLAANTLSKTPQSVAQLLQRIQEEPASRPWALWRLGALGNRGVEPAAVLRHLLAYSRDRSEQTRYWAVEGLAMLGTDATLDPLLEILRRDPSPQIRQRAAFSLSQAGMLTKQQRLATVPDLLNCLDDDGLDNTTRSLVFQALRGISGTALPNDPAAWRDWWANRAHGPKQQRQRVGVLRASAARPAGDLPT